jgi:hypothetical protein
VTPAVKSYMLDGYVVNGEKLMKKRFKGVAGK